MKDKKVESGKNENENKNKQTGKKLNNEGLGKVSGGANPAFKTEIKIDFTHIPSTGAYGTTNPRD